MIKRRAVIGDVGLKYSLGLGMVWTALAILTQKYRKFLGRPSVLHNQVKCSSYRDTYIGCPRLS